MVQTVAERSRPRRAGRLQRLTRVQKRNKHFQRERESGGGIGEDRRRVGKVSNRGMWVKRRQGDESAGRQWL